MQKKQITIALLAAMALSATAQDMSDNFYRAIRNDNLSEVRGLIKSAGLTVKDKRGTTPLMMSAAYGSLDSMKLLIDAGADVNAKNDFDATALMWCINDPAKVRLLLSKGAKVNAKSKQSRTPLLLAAAHDGASETVKLLLDRGADPKARTNIQAGALLMAAEANDTASAKLLLQKGLDVNDKDKYGDTPLMSAAAHGNLELVKLFLAKGADVNAVSAESSGEGVKNGPIALGSFTPLILAAAYGGSDVVKVLLDAGAKVDARDVRGMTPLMLAVATDRPDPRVVRLLAEKTDKSIRSKDGETALDWAKKFNNKSILAVFGEKQQGPRAAALTPVADREAPELRPAVEKSIGLLQNVSDKFFSTGGCASCHAQNLTGLALSAARAQGVAINEASEAGGLQGAKGFWASFEQPLLQRIDPPGAGDTIMYALLHFSAGKIEPGPVTDAMVHNLAGEQRLNGAWHFGGVARAPMEDGDFSRTAFSVRALRLYGMPGRKADLDMRIAKASNWLREAAPQNIEDQNMQLLGLKWAGADGRTIDRLAKKVAALQRADGGWAQTKDLPGDAYATGQALYAMREAGVAASDPVYQRGVGYLLRTQLADGSWHVKSRAPKFQPYFQSGFPHDHDQWISMSATAWAATALANALPAAGRTVAAIR